MAEHFDVLIIGAGLSGIGAAWRLQQHRPGSSYAVLEARAAIGGTWDLFRYPGVRSDSDMFTLSYPFRPWQGDRSLASGADIRAYIQDTADAGGITPHIRFSARVVAADWAGDRWTVRLAGGETLTCGFLYACAGYYDYAKGHEPDFPGLADFTGRLVHPQSWPADLDHAGRRVVVIGSGATAVTLVPAMAGTAAHVTMLQRSPSYLTSLPGRDAVADLLRRRLPARAAHKLARAKNILLSQGFYQLARRRPERVKAVLRRFAVQHLEDPAYVDEHFTPTYQPWDQRLCIVPDGDLFEAIKAGRADVVTDHIDRFVPEGIRLRSGRTLPADIVVSATGLSLLAIGGVTLTVDGRAVEPGRSVAYRGVMLSGVPNFAYCIGYTNASWTLRADLSHRYVCRLLAHLDRHGYASATPREKPGNRRPLLDLTSGYVQRALDRFPQQGDKDPWTVRQNYLLDVLTTPRADVRRDMTFTRRTAPRPRGDPMTRLSPYRFRGRTAVLTGAASGIGEQLAYGLAARGSGLVLVDRDALRLDAVAERIRAEHPGLAVETLVADLADRAAVLELAAGLRERHPELGLLVNNAGTALGGRFDQLSLAQFERVMAVNFTAPLLLTHHLLPALTAAPGSHLVNVSSLYGLIAPPGQSAYSASKFALRGFSEALRGELLESGVGVTTVHPGGIRTRIAESAEVGAGVPAAEVEPQQRVFAALLTYPPERAAREILDGVERRRGRVLIAASAKLPDLLARLLPVSHMRVIGRLTAAAGRRARTAVTR